MIAFIISNLALGHCFTLPKAHSRPFFSNLNRRASVALHSVVLPLKRTVNEIGFSDNGQWAAQRPTSVTKSTIFMRAFLLGSLGLTMAFQQPINGLIASFWESACTNAFFRHDMFEPIVAVSSFFFW